MSFTKSQVQRIIKQYKQGRSMGAIAEDLKTYKNAIRRVLIGNGVEIRTRSQAQKLALESGRAEHPTEGRKRTKEEKIRISDGMTEHWEEMSDEEKDRRSDLAKAQWEAMSEEDREALMAAANEAVRIASKEGSKLEKSLKEHLTNENFVVEYHRGGLIPNHRMEIDLYIPELGTAIEIDGPSHFLPIWGHETLQKTIGADLEKSGLLISNGFVIIRVKHIHKSVSNHLIRKVNEEVIKSLQKIRKRKPPKDKRIIEIEV